MFPCCISPQFTCLEGFSHVWICVFCSSQWSLDPWSLNAWSLVSVRFSFQGSWRVRPWKQGRRLPPRSLGPWAQEVINMRKPTTQCRRDLWRLISRDISRLSWHLAACVFPRMTDPYDPFLGSAQVRIVSTSAACNVTEAGAESTLHLGFPAMILHAGWWNSNTRFLHLHEQFFWLLRGHGHECKTAVFAMASSLTNLTTLDEDQLLNVHVFSSLYCWLFYLYQAKPE